MYRPNFAWRVVAPYPTHAGAAAMPECGWWRKREYSNARVWRVEQDERTASKVALEFSPLFPQGLSLFDAALK